MEQNLKLIVEAIPTEVFESKVEESKGQLYIIGCAAQADVINGNSRLYPKNVLVAAMTEYNDAYVKTNKALGELNHPPRPYADPKMSSHLITEMWMEGANVMAKALVLNTSNGKELRALIEGGWQVQASTRGLGVPKVIQESNKKQSYSEIIQYKMTVGFDVVQDQSAPNATMTGIYECKNGLYVPTSNAIDNTDWDIFFKKLRKTYTI